MSPVPYLEKYYQYCVPQDGSPQTYSSSLILFLSSDTDTLKKASQFVKPASGLCSTIKLDSLRALIISLKSSEHDFHSEVLNPNNTDFLIATYYSLYLRFLESIYSVLEVLEPLIPDPDIDIITATVNVLIGYFGTPILNYITKKEAPPGISELAGILLHALTSTGKVIPSKDSFGHFLFSSLHK